jgi:hypothetical protein
MKLLVWMPGSSPGMTPSNAGNSIQIIVTMANSKEIIKAWQE